MYTKYILKFLLFSMLIFIGIFIFLSPSQGQYIASPYIQYGKPFGVNQYNGFGNIYGLYSAPYGSGPYGGMYGINQYSGFGNMYGTYSAPYSNSPYSGAYGLNQYAGYGSMYGMYSLPYGSNQYGGLYGMNQFSRFGNMYVTYGTPYANSLYGGVYGQNQYAGFGGMYGMYGTNGIYGVPYGSNLYGGFYGPSQYGGTTTVTLPSSNITSEVTVSVNFKTNDLDSSTSDSLMSYITLNGNSINLEGGGAVVNGCIITITSSGMYSISGTLYDGQIIVNTTDEDLEAVKLVLNGADITCSTSAPIYVINAKKTVITLADGTNNYLTDGYSYILEDASSDEPNAAVFSKDDLTINGSGSLTVKANYNNGITGKDKLKIISGNITVNALHDGIKGRDCIAVKDGTITVKAGDDGMQSNNDEDPEKGFVYIEGGSFNINAGADGIQAETTVFITGGNINITTGGGSNNTSSSDSAKGIKAAVNVIIAGGNINVDSSDDSIHSNDSLTINGGDITLASGDDAIHSDLALEINGADITITKCYEGLESEVIIINAGNIHLVSSDDGINIVSSEGTSSMFGGPGQMGQDNFNSDNYLCIYGGYIAIDSMGDGLDINGPVYMTAGTLIINGPTRNDNGALDCNGFYISGGFLVAVGSSGMAQAPSTSSTQCSIMMNLQVSWSAGTMVHIENQSSKNILSFVPTKVYQSIVLSSPELQMGTTYRFYTGGWSSGTVNDGLYSGGTYTAGNLVNTFTISSIVTTLGYSNGFPGGPF